MTEMLANARTSLLYWKLFIFKVINGVVMVAAAGIVTALAGVDWASLSGSQKLIIICSILITVGKYLDGLFDKTLSKLSDGKDASENQPNLKP